MALDLSMIQGMGFGEILLWVLSFAIVFGILSQVEMPKNKGTRGIIAMVVAFFSLFAAAGTGLIGVLSSMSMGLLLIILAVIVFIIFLETAGVKTGKFQKDPNTGKIMTGGVQSILKQHSLAFAVALIIIALFVFIGAGGLDLIGFKVNLQPVNIMTLFFFGIIILAVVWMIANPGEVEK